MLDTEARRALRDMIESCRARSVLKRHGSWFLQLQPDVHTHLNFWGHPAKATPPIRTNIHNHDTSFTSRICWGALRNLCYAATAIENADAVGALRVYVVGRRPNAPVQFVQTTRYMTATLIADETHGVGAVYTMEADTFHLTQILTPTITWLTQRKDGPFPQLVLIPQGGGPNPATMLKPVDIEADRAEAWARIDGLCALAGI